MLTIWAYLEILSSLLIYNELPLVVCGDLAVGGCCYCLTTRRQTKHRFVLSSRVVIKGTREDHTQGVCLQKSPLALCQMQASFLLTSMCSGTVALFLAVVYP